MSQIGAEPTEAPGADAGAGSASAFRCAAAARERNDPQLGTAPPTRRWLLIEHPGPWPVDALPGSGLAPVVLEQLTRACQAERARPLLIRRPGRTPAAARRSWAVSYENGCTRWGSWADDGELNEAAAALAAPAPVADPGGNDAPVLLACTHGLHDVCCAVRGRPVAAALAREWPTATWECSHVGGDRFAANLVVLPDGVYYGNLDADSAVATVRSHLRGQVPVAFLRGMTWLPPAAQVAVAAVHRRYGPFAAGDVEVVALDQSLPGRWRLELSTPLSSPSRITATVDASRRAVAKLTCRAPAETPATEYQVVSLQAG